MISVLVAAAVGLGVTLFGTPVAIRAFSVWGWGQFIREDGPHTHFEKMGTPTMGGIVMLVGLLAGYGAARLTFGSVTGAGLSLVIAAPISPLSRPPRFAFSGFALALQGLSRVRLSAVGHA